jgi:hypothetical protein
MSSLTRKQEKTLELTISMRRECLEFCVKTPEKGGRRPVTPEVAGSSPVSLAIPVGKELSGVDRQFFGFTPRLRTERGFNPGCHAAAVWPRRTGARESERAPHARFTRMWRRIWWPGERRLILRDRATPRGDRQTVRFAPSTRSEARMRIAANKVRGIDAGDREMMVEYH